MKKNSKLRILAAAAALFCLLAACKTSEGGEAPSASTSEPAPSLDVGPDPAPPESPELPPAAAVGASLESGTIKNEAGETLVRYELAAPEIKEDSESARIINAYYSSQTQKRLDYVNAELYEAAYENQRIGGGFIPYFCGSDFEVTYNQGAFISVVRRLRDEYGGETIETIRTETFNVENGGIMTADDFFTAEETVYTERLVSYVIESIDGESGGDYYEGYAQAAVVQFDKSLFGISGEGYIVYYQAGEIAETAKSFTVPYAYIDDLLEIKP